MHTNAILAGVAALLAIPTVYTIYAERGSFTEYDTIPRLFEGFTTDNISFVVLSKKKEGTENTPPNPNVPPGQPDPATLDQLVFQKTDDGWVLSGQNELAGAPIQQSKVENDVLQHVKSIRRDEQALVEADAADGAMKAKGLTDDTGILIQCLNAERMAMAELYRGNDASGGEFSKEAVKGWFVARKGRNDVILYEPNPPYWYVTVNPEDWIDKKVQEFQIDKVTSFSLRNPEGQVRFTRAASEGAEGAAAGNDWVAEATPEGKAAVRQQEVNNLLSRFNYVSCSRYLGRIDNPKWAPKVPQPNNADIEVTATLEDGTRHVMWIGKKIADKNEYFARFEGGAAGQFLVAIGEWIRQPFVDKKIGDMFDPTAPKEEAQPVKPEDPQAPKPEEGKAPAEEGKAEEGKAPAGEGKAEEGAAAPATAEGTVPPASAENKGESKAGESGATPPASKPSSAAGSAEKTGKQAVGQAEKGATTGK